MDFNDYAGDDMDTSLVVLSSDGYFASQALRSGLLGGAATSKPPLPNPGREAVEREIMKERIREEILAREMLERRILEEEVRREIELERIMEVRRLQMERWPGLAGICGMAMHGDRLTQTYMPSWLETGISASLGRGTAPDPAEFAVRDRPSSQLLQKKTMAVMAPSAVRHESEKPSPSNEDAVEFTFDKVSPSHLLQKKAPAVVAQSSLQNKLEKHLPSNKKTTSNCKLSGAKRKAQGESPFQPEKQWGCALCKVTSSSEEALKEHLQGRKHKAKEALLCSNKKTCFLQSKQNESLPLEVVGASDGWPLKKKEGKKQQKLYCNICRAKCNSIIMMEHHLAGRKHRNVIEAMKANVSFKAEAVKTAANEKVGNNERAVVIEEELETACQSMAPSSFGV